MLIPLMPQSRIEAADTPEVQVVGLSLQDFAEGDIIFRDPPLVAAQHSGNRADALVCAQCFRYVGSIEQQLKHRILGDAVDTMAGETAGETQA